MVYVKSSFLSSTHGSINCTGCHAGDADATDKEAAHVNLVARPSEADSKFCGSCHGDVSSRHSTSLHNDLKGYYNLIAKRLGRDISTDPETVAHFNKECGKCHAGCGQCHVSRPVSVEGGFIDGHNFQRTPNMKENCTACHGSRVGAEYFGENEGLKPDVHWIPSVKRCDFCHDASSIHGSSAGAATRYEDRDVVRCDKCHASAKTKNLYHIRHWDDLSCQVCHSQPYKNCNSCHTGGAGITGSSYIAFKIGKNHLQSEQRPYKYVPVRHIPISRDTFASWGIPDLPNYNSEPTWKHATPHNIQRWTAQTDTTGGGFCASKCHNSKYYLRLEDVAPEEIEANRPVIM